MGGPVIYWTFLLICSAYVLPKGGPPERIAMAIALVASAVSHLAYIVQGTHYTTVQTGIFVIDVVTFFAFLLLALRADRFWPLWITGIHLVGVAAHAAKLVDPAVIPWAYSVTQSLWSYLILLLIVIGASRHQGRLKRYGVDRSWNGSFTAAGLSTPRTGPTA